MTKKVSPGLLILVFLLTLGLFIRLLGGVPIISTDLVYSPGKSQNPTGSKTPEDAVKSFYIFIDNGAYEKAWELSLEPDWKGGAGAYGYREEISSSGKAFMGFTGKETFVKRLNEELGNAGSGITLRSIDAEVIEPIDPSIFGESYGLKNVRDAFRVRAKGNILGACTIFRWEKELIVLGFGKGYKVLLSGTKNKNSYFYQSWFSNIERIGDLRGSQQ